MYHLQWDAENGGGGGLVAVWLLRSQGLVARQANLVSRQEFSRQEYWGRLPFPSPGDLPYSGIEPGSPALQADSLPTELPGKLPGKTRGKGLCGGRGYIGNFCVSPLISLWAQTALKNSLLKNERARTIVQWYSRRISYYLTRTYYLPGMRNP